MPIDIPRLGLGTWANDDPDQCAETVRHAIDMGYRHIDTAQGYGNEAAVGRGIKLSAADRSEILVATKVSTGNLAYDDVIESTKRSLQKLDLETIDLLYIHWPLRTYDAEETLSAFNALHEDGLIAYVGLSNFEPAQLDEARRHLEAPLVAHQVEMHPLCPQDTLLEYAQEHDHWLVAYSPLARGEIFDHPVIEAVAQQANIHPAQVCLAWLLSKDNVAAIPKATGDDHLASNLEAADITLTADQIERLDSIERESRVVNPGHAPWNQ